MHQIQSLQLEHFDGGLVSVMFDELADVDWSALSRVSKGMSKCMLAYLKKHSEALKSILKICLKDPACPKPISGNLEEMAKKIKDHENFLSYTSQLRCTLLAFKHLEFGVTAEKSIKELLMKSQPCRMQGDLLSAIIFASTHSIKPVNRNLEKIMTHEAHEAILLHRQDRLNACDFQFLFTQKYYGEAFCFLDECFKKLESKKMILFDLLIKQTDSHAERVAFNKFVQLDPDESFVTKLFKGDKLLPALLLLEQLMGVKKNLGVGQYVLVPLIEYICDKLEDPKRGNSIFETFTDASKSHFSEHNEICMKGHLPRLAARLACSFAKKGMRAEAESTLQYVQPAMLPVFENRINQLLLDQ